MVTKKVVNSIKRKGEPGILCKLDLKKVYDHMNWDFWDYIMSKMGFADKLRR